MATVTVDVGAVAPTAPEIARAISRGTSVANLVAVIQARILDLQASLKEYRDVSDAGQTRTDIDAIVAKLV